MCSSREIEGCPVPLGRESAIPLLGLTIVQVGWGFKGVEVVEYWEETAPPLPSPAPRPARGEGAEMCMLAKCAYKNPGAWPGFLLGGWAVSLPRPVHCGTCA